MENLVIGWFIRFGTPVSILHDFGGGGFNWSDFSIKVNFWIPWQNYSRFIDLLRWSGWKAKWDR